MPKSKSDPLLAALIAKLPPSGTEWPVDRQMAWLNLMAMAFGTVYGGNAIEQVPFLRGEKVGQFEPKVRFVAPPEHRFLIDKNGYVRRGTGERVSPKDIDADVFDERGQMGDLRTIVWADDSTGLNGADIMIRS